MSHEKELKPSAPAAQMQEIESGTNTKAAPAFQLKADSPIQKKDPPAAGVETEAATSETTTDDTFDRSSLKAVSSYTSTKGHSTLYGKKQSDGLGHTLKTETTKGTIGYNQSGKKSATMDEYGDAVDALYDKRNESTKNKITDDQKALLEIARKASKDSAYFDQVIDSSPAAKTAEVDYSGAMLENDSFTFSPLLKERIAKFHKFMVSIGLYTTKKAKIGGNAALRKRPIAHKWSTEHYITQNKNASQTMANFKAMYVDSAYLSGDIIQDKDKLPWAKKSHFVDKASAVTTDMAKVDDTKTFAKIRAYVDTFNYRPNKSSLASEGYASGDAKRFPNTNAVGVSNHIFGNALDLPTAGFVYKTDPINDYVAWEFGLQRNVSGETWHFECTGMPMTAATEATADQE